MKKRTRSRLWAIQAAYSLSMRPESSGGLGDAGASRVVDVALEKFFTWRKIAPENRGLSARLIQSLWKNLAQVDSLLAAHLKNWSVERLCRLDRIIIRLALTEILFLDDIPEQVTINEYVDLARMFGTDNSPAFVNGVLDAALKNLTLDKKVLS